MIRAPVIKTQEVDAPEQAELPCAAAIAMRQSDIGEQPWHSVVMYRMPVAAGLLAYVAPNVCTLPHQNCSVTYILPLLSS
jgi:hypothetical protein